MTRCHVCGTEAATIPPEPPIGTWVKDRHGGVSQRRIDSDGNDGWGMPGFYSFGKWDRMWTARGPLTECEPWGKP
jgi:hypothetical protein